MGLCSIYSLRPCHCAQDKSRKESGIWRDRDAYKKRKDQKRATASGQHSTTLAASTVHDPRHGIRQQVFQKIYARYRSLAVKNMSMDNFTERNAMKPCTSVHPSKAPVLFLIFNRPETTKQVFQAIRRAQPAKLYVAADGPRESHPDDKQRCDLARKIATDVDWDCEVHTLFQHDNLGCGRGPSTAITWFFENE